MGELIPEKGKCEVGGTVAFASQVPWLFSDGTIRDNILCGHDYYARRYEDVIKATSLERDFSLLAEGDHTVVGGKGITLSGGQKARINLARCLYNEADIYILDDPFSSVDTNVGRHIFDVAVNQFLRGKTRIIVTHQVQYLNSFDDILILEKVNSP